VIREVPRWEGEAPAWPKWSPTRNCSSFAQLLSGRGLIALLVIRLLVLPQVSTRCRRPSETERGHTIFRRCQRTSVNQNRNIRGDRIRRIGRGLSLWPLCVPLVWFCCLAGLAGTHGGLAGTHCVKKLWPCISESKLQRLWMLDSGYFS
jgi:hypothetical protein